MGTNGAAGDTLQDTPTRDETTIVVAPLRVRNVHTAILFAAESLCGRRGVVAQRYAALGVMGIRVVKRTSASLVKLLDVISVPPAHPRAFGDTLVDDVLGTVPVLLSDCVELFNK